MPVSTASAAVHILPGIIFAPTHFPFHFIYDLQVVIKIFIEHTRRRAQLIGDGDGFNDKDAQDDIFYDQQVSYPWKLFLVVQYSYFFCAKGVSYCQRLETSQSDGGNL